MQEVARSVLKLQIASGAADNKTMDPSMGAITTGVRTPLKPAWRRESISVVKCPESSEMHLTIKSTRQRPSF